MNIKSLFKEAQKSIKANSPEILLGLGIAGMVTSMIFAVKATPKALQLIEEETEKKGEELTGKEIGKTVWKCYIPTVGMTAVSAACLIGGNRIKSKRALALYSAYEISKASFQTYKDDIVDKIGEKRVEKAEAEIAEEKIFAKNDSLEKKVYKIVDAFTGMEFEATPTQVQKAMNDICFTINRRGFASVNDLYEILNVKPWPLGEDHGWGIRKCIEGSGQLPDITLNPFLDENDNAWLELVYSEEPYACYDAQWL